MKKILIILALFMASFSHCASVCSNALNLTSYRSETATIFHCTDNKFIKDKLMSLTKFGAFTGLSNLCSKLKNPALVIISGKFLSMTYTFLINSCEHLTSTVQNLTNEKSLVELLKSASDSAAPGLMYGIGESVYNSTEVSKRKILGDAATSVICLDFICDNCCANSQFGGLAMPLLKGMAAKRIVDLAKDNKQLITKSSVQKPLILMTCMAAGVAAYFSIANEPEIDFNIPTLVSTIESTVQQAALYSSAYKLGIGFLSSAFDLLSTIKNKSIKFLKL